MSKQWFDIIDIVFSQIVASHKGRQEVGQLQHRGWGSVQNRWCEAMHGQQSDTRKIQENIRTYVLKNKGLDGLKTFSLKIGLWASSIVISIIGFFISLFMIIKTVH